jgi:type VI secretion system secreted protein Hcp
MAVDMFLKIDGIEGESADKKHKNEIVVQSYYWGAYQTGTSATGTGGAGSGKVHMKDFHFTMHVNKATPKLIVACATGQHIAKVMLTVRKAGGQQQDFLQYEFQDVLISSYETSHGFEYGDQANANGAPAAGSTPGASDLPLEHIKLNYTQMKCDYKEQKADGSLGGVVSGGYNLKAGDKV